MFSLLGSNIQTAQQQFQGNAFDHYHRAFSWRSRDCRAPNRGEPRLSLRASPRDHAELLAGLFPRGNDRGSASVAGVVRVASPADVIAGLRVLQQPNGPIAAPTGAPSPLRHVFRCVSVSHAQSAVHSAALLAVRAAAVLQSAGELSRSSLPSLRPQQRASRPRHRPDPLLRHAARLRRPPRRRRNHRYFWNSAMTPRKEGGHDQQVLWVLGHGDFQRAGGASLRHERSVLPAIPPSAARRDRVGVVDAGGENVPRVLPKTQREMPGSRDPGPRRGRIRSNCRV